MIARNIQQLRRMIPLLACACLLASPFMSQAFDLSGLSMWAGVGHAAAGLGLPTQPTTDCNFNTIPDECDIDCGALAGACNVPGCGNSLDCNSNGIPDECELLLVRLYSIDWDEPFLHVIDPATGGTLDSIEITIPGGFIEGGLGLATDPTTGELWAILLVFNTWDQLFPIPELATIDPRTGRATSVGPLYIGYAAGLAFAPDGTLFAVTDEFEIILPIPEVLFTVSKTNAAAMLRMPFYTSGEGEAFAFNPFDWLFYRVGGEDEGAGTQIFESIDFGPPVTVDPIGVSDPIFDYPGGMTYDLDLLQSQFLLAAEYTEDRDIDDPALFTLAADGQVTYVGDMDHWSKGLAFVVVNNDCNGNLVPDDCDVPPLGVGHDCNENGVPDECEGDCNDNGVPDDCDVDPDDPDGNSQVSEDCDANGIPDECEPDCDGNDTPDACELGGLYSLSSWSPLVHRIAPANGSSLTSAWVSFPDDGTNVCGGNGLATHPTSGVLWAILEPAGTRGPPQRVLATIDPHSGAANFIGALDDAFSGLAFDDRGVLYGITGDGAATPDTLYTLDQNDATATFLMALNPAQGNGEAIAFNPDDGLLYRMGAPTEAPPRKNGAEMGFEAIDLNTHTATNIELSGHVWFGSARGMVYDASQGCFLLGAGFIVFDELNGLFSVTTTGEVTFLGFLSHASKGLAFVDGSGDCNLNGIPDECEADCNNNGMADDCDVAADLTAFGIPLPMDLLDGGRGRQDELSLSGFFIGLDPVSGLYDLVGQTAPDDEEAILINKDVTVDPTTGEIYTIGFPIDLEGQTPAVGQFIYRLDPDTGQGTQLPQPVTADDLFIMLGLTFGPDGTLYGIGYGGFCAIDKTTGAVIEGSINEDVFGIGMATSPAGDIYSVSIDLEQIEPYIPDLNLSGRGDDGLIDGLMMLQTHDADTGDVLTTVNVTDPTGFARIVIDIAYGASGDLYAFTLRPPFDIDPALLEELLGDNGRGIGRDSGEFFDLVTIDPATGEMTTVREVEALLLGLGGPLTDPDCNDNGIPDDCELAGNDCNSNGVPDDCDIASGFSKDCQPNGIPDECEEDCNNNGVPDDYDITSGFSKDCQPNGIPDECETDCQPNDIPDDCDIASGTSQDCNDNGVPDECDIADGTSKDCNDNGVPDECDITDGTSKDCNDNGVPDECDITDGTSKDCNSNSIPDECDITSGTSSDCDGNGVPDECDPPLVLGDCPDSITIQATDAEGIVVTYPTPPTENGCHVVVTVEPPSGTLFPIGTTTVTVTASDDLGQLLSCTFGVTVLPPPEPGPEPPPEPEPDCDLLRILLSIFFGAPICGLFGVLPLPLTFAGLVVMKSRARRRTHGRHR